MAQMKDWRECTKDIVIRMGLGNSSGPLATVEEACALSLFVTCDQLFRSHETFLKDWWKSAAGRSLLSKPLTPVQQHILMILRDFRESPEWIKPNTFQGLEEILVIPGRLNQAMVSELVGRLKQEGLIETKGASDKRKRCKAMDLAGSHLMADLCRNLGPVLARIFTKETDPEGLIEALSRIRQNSLDSQLPRPQASSQRLTQQPRAISPGDAAYANSWDVAKRLRLNRDFVCEEELFLLSLLTTSEALFECQDLFLRRYNLRSAAYNALMIISSQADPPSLLQIEKSLIVPGRMSQKRLKEELDKLERAELVSYVDGKVTRIKLEDKGLHLIEELLGSYYLTLRLVMAHVGTLLDLCARLTVIRENCHQRERELWMSYLAVTYRPGSL